jgi:hypothetical protein
MKTTSISRRTIANPRRTTLAHISDLAELGMPRELPAEPAQPPVLVSRRTANPRRTVLSELPKTPVTP